MRPLTKRILLVLADILTLVLSCFVAYYLAELLGFRPSDIFITQWYIIVGIKLAVYFAFSMYSTDPDRLAVLDFAGSGVANIAADAVLIYLFSVPIRDNVMPFSISLVWDIVLCFLLRVMLMPREDEIDEDIPDEYDSAEIRMAEKDAVYFPGNEGDLEAEAIPDEPPAELNEVPELGELNLDSLFDNEEKDQADIARDPEPFRALNTVRAEEPLPAAEITPQTQDAAMTAETPSDESDIFDFSSLDIDFPDDTGSVDNVHTDETSPFESFVNGVQDYTFPDIDSMDIDSILEGISDAEFGGESSGEEDDLFGEDNWKRMDDELSGLDWDVDSPTVTGTVTAVTPEDATPSGPQALQPAPEADVKAVHTDTEGTAGKNEEPGEETTITGKEPEPVSSVSFSDLDLEGVFPAETDYVPEEEPHRETIPQLQTAVPSSDELASEIDDITDEYHVADVPAPAEKVIAAVIPQTTVSEPEPSVPREQLPEPVVTEEKPPQKEAEPSGTVQRTAETVSADIEASVQEAVNIEDIAEPVEYTEENADRSAENSGARQLRDIFGIERSDISEQDYGQYTPYRQEEGKMDNRNDDQFGRNADAALARIKKQEIIDSLVSDIKNMYMNLSDKNKTLEERERELFVKYVQLDQREKEMSQRRERLSDASLEEKHRNMTFEEDRFVPRDNPSVVWDINRAIDSRYQGPKAAPFILGSVEDQNEDKVHSELEALKKEQASQREEEQRALREELEALREQVRSGRQKEEDERLRKEQEEKAELERLRQAEAERIRAEEERKEAEKQAEIERLRKAQEELDRIHQAEEEKAELERLRREKDEQDIARIVEAREAEIRASEEQRNMALKEEMERQINLLRQEYEARYQESQENLIRENEELRAEKEASQKMIELAKQAAERLVEEEASLRESEKASFDEELSRIKAEHEEALRRAEEERRTFEEQLQADHADVERRLKQEQEEALRRAEEEKKAFEEQLQAVQADAERRMIEDAKMRDAEREAHREELRKAREDADRAAREKIRMEENELEALKETILLGKQEAEEKARAEREKARLDQERIRLEKEKAEAELRTLEDTLRRLKEEVAGKESENAALQKQVEISQNRLEDALGRAEHIEAERAALEENMRRERAEAEQRRLESLRAVLEGSSEEKGTSDNDAETYVPEVQIVSSGDDTDTETSGTSLLDML